MISLKGSGIDSVPMSHQSTYGVSLHLALCQTHTFVPLVRFFGDMISSRS